MKGDKKMSKNVYSELIVKVNYAGVSYFTCINHGKFVQHESLETAADYLHYNGFDDFAVTTKVNLSY